MYEGALEDRDEDGVAAEEYRWEKLRLLFCSGSVDLVAGI